VTVRVAVHREATCGRGEGGGTGGRLRGIRLLQQRAQRPAQVVHGADVGGRGLARGRVQAAVGEEAGERAGVGDRVAGGHHDLGGGVDEVGGHRGSGLVIVEYELHPLHPFRTV
jgi:hypothetical protein